MHHAGKRAELRDEPTMKLALRNEVGCLQVWTPQLHLPLQLQKYLRLGTGTVTENRKRVVARQFGS
jgi:hypothetical protein